MKTMKTLAIAGGISLFTLSCMAQEDEAPTNYIYSSYFYCGGGPLSRVDELTAETAPMMDKLVEDGEITGWGWYCRHTGGRWQRLTYHTASSMDQLLDGSNAIQAALVATNDDDDDADDDGDQLRFGQICPQHDDYIWGPLLVRVAAVMRLQKPVFLPTIFVMSTARSVRTKSSRNMWRRSWPSSWRTASC